MKKTFVLIPFLFLSLLTGACSQSESAPTTPTLEELARSVPDVGLEDPVNPVDESAALVTAPQVLLFNGIGISVSDWQQTEQIVKAMGLTYRLVNAAALNAMSLINLQKYKLILVPGGNSNTINSSRRKSRVTWSFES